MKSIISETIYFNDSESSQIEVTFSFNPIIKDPKMYFILE